MMRISQQKIIFSTGKVIQCNEGIIGIAPDLSLSEGCAGYITDELYVLETDSFVPAINQQEKGELADYMIEQWLKFKKTPPVVRI